MQLDSAAGLDLSLTKSPNTAFTGCADMYTQLTVNAGATGNFFGLFNANTKVALWDRKFPLWNVSP